MMSVDEIKQTITESLEQQILCFLKDGNEFKMPVEIDGKTCTVRVGIDNFTIAGGKLSADIDIRNINELCDNLNK